MFTLGRYCRVASSLRDKVVPKTLANFLKLKTQLYEQGADIRRIGQYVRNWWRWVRAFAFVYVLLSRSPKSLLGFLKVAA